MAKIAAGVAAALLALLLVQSCRLQSADARWAEKLAPVQAERDRLTEELARSELAVTTLTRANGRQQSTIHELASKLDAAITQTEQLDALLAAAEAGAAEARRSRDAALAAMTQQQEQDYASNRDCADWGAAAVCGAVSARVSEQWRAASNRGRD